MDFASLSLTLSTAVPGFALYLLPKTRAVVITCTLMMFGLMVYPFWHVARGNSVRQVAVLVGWALVVFVIAKKAWPATPTWDINAYLAPDGMPYPAGTIVGGIKWQDNYVDVRLDFANGPVPIKNLDFTVSLAGDVMIAGVGQLGNIPQLTANSALAVPPVWIGGPDNLIAMDAVMAGPPISPAYRVNCETLFRDTTLRLIIAAAAMNPPVGGLLPDEMFAPRRPPRGIRIEGFCETFPSNGGQTYRIQFSRAFT